MNAPLKFSNRVIFFIHLHPILDGVINFATIVLQPNLDFQEPKVAHHRKKNIASQSFCYKTLLTFLGISAKDSMWVCNTAKVPKPKIKQTKILVSRLELENFQGL